MTNVEEKIITLCRMWHQAKLNPQGGISIGENTEQYCLYRNGINFHELSFEQITTALSHLAGTLMAGPRFVAKGSDHYLIWSWCAEVLFSRTTGFFSQQDADLKNLFDAAIRASLANCLTVEEFKKRSKLPEDNPEFFVRTSHIVLAYLSFPLLEGVLRRACSNVVNSDGEVIKKFHTPYRNYDPQSGGKQKLVRCNNVGHLLWYFYHNISDDNHRKRLDVMFSQISTLGGSLDIYQIVSGWRNSSLHGSEHYFSIGGVMLNLSLSISLFGIQDSYDLLRPEIMKSVQSNIEHQKRYGKELRNPWQYYPPY